MGYPRYRVRIAIPGPSADWFTIQSALESGTEHDYLLPNTIGHGSCGNFDECFCEAVNAFEAGELTHMLYYHADVHVPVAGSADVMMRVSHDRKVSLVSAPVAIKDGREVVSCGVPADPDDPWMAKPVKIADLDKYPLDFDAADLGAPGKELLHNTGYFLMDLRDPGYHKTDALGDLLMCFNFPRRNRRGADGRWAAQGNSEDWYFSRMAARLGIKSVITRRVKVLHRGTIFYPNWDRRKEIAEAQEKLQEEVNQKAALREAGRDLVACGGPSDA